MAVLSSARERSPRTHSSIQMGRPHQHVCLASPSQLGSFNYFIFENLIFEWIDFDFNSDSFISQFDQYLAFEINRMKVELSSSKLDPNLLTPSHK